MTPQVRELDQNRVDLIFEVDEGPVTGVRNINFIGNHAFADKTLRDAIVTTESHWWNFFTKNDNYDPDRMEYDRKQTRSWDWARVGPSFHEYQKFGTLVFE